MPNGYFTVEQAHHMTQTELLHYVGSGCIPTLSYKLAGVLLHAIDLYWSDEYDRLSRAYDDLKNDLIELREKVDE